MLMLLPKPRDRAAIRSFWTSLSVVFGAAMTGLAAVVWDASRIWVGPALGVLVALPGILWPQRFDLVYRAWNRIARIVGRRATAYVAWVFFVTVVLAARDGQDRMMLERPNRKRTLWTERLPQSDEAYGHQHGLLVPHDPPRRWWMVIGSWAGRAGNRWILATIPFLGLLRLIDTTDGGSATTTPPQETYTLY